MKSERLKLVGVRIPESVWEELKEIAASRSGRLKASHIIREALDEKIEREKKAKR